MAVSQRSAQLDGKHQTTNLGVRGSKSLRARQQPVQSITFLSRPRRSCFYMEPSVMEAMWKQNVSWEVVTQRAI